MNLYTLRISVLIFVSCIMSCLLHPSLCNHFPLFMVVLHILEKWYTYSFHVFTYSYLSMSFSLSTMGKKQTSKVTEPVIKKQEKNTTKKGANAVEVGQKGKEAEDEEDDESYDEEEDEDYDPSKVDKAGGSGAGAGAEDSDSEGDEEKEAVPDFSAIESSGERLVQTRRQRQETEQLGRKIPEGLVQPSKYLSVNVDDIFQSLKEQSARGEVVELKIVDEKVKTGAGASANNAIDSTIPSDSTTTNESKPSGGPEMITIESSYTFAGKVITEKKEVEIGSAEAKAYLNSTGNIIAKSNESGIARSFVPIVREVDGEHLELRIKLKRPSLIDKFLSIQGNKQQKLSTLEKSRLDWASFVDKRKIQDDLRLHNKDGYLDKQAFLNRVELKKDEQYKKAQDEDRKNRLNNEQQ